MSEKHLKRDSHKIRHIDWAKHIGGQFREEHTMDQETLVAMMDEDKSVYAREEWDDLGLEEEES